LRAKGTAGFSLTAFGVFPDWVSNTTVVLGFAAVADKSCDNRNRARNRRCARKGTNP
jgi:hypothetical protein